MVQKRERGGWAFLSLSHTYKHRCNSGGRQEGEAKAIIPASEKANQNAQKMKKRFHDKIPQPASVSSVYLCSVLDLNRHCKGCPSMSGSKLSAFHGQQIKPGSVVTAFQG